MNSGSPGIDRPEICFVNWGAIPENCPAPQRDWQTGMFLRNDGRLVAHDISIEPIEIDGTVTAHARKIAQIRRDGIEFAPVWLLGYERKWDVSAAMAEAALRRPGSAVYRGDFCVKVTALYRDSQHFWYRTVAELRYLPAQHRLEFGPCTLEAVGLKEPNEQASSDADGLGDKVHDLLGDYLQRMAESGSSHRQLLAQLAGKLYDVHAAKRVELVRPEHPADVARFDNGHAIRADLAVWQPLRSYGVRLDDDEPEAIELALTSARIRWRKVAERRARKAVDNPDKSMPLSVLISECPDDFQDIEPTSAPGDPARTRESTDSLRVTPDCNSDSRRFVPSDPQGIEQKNSDSVETSDLDKNPQEAGQNATIPRLPLQALKSIMEIEQTTRAALVNSVPKHFPFPFLILDVPKITDILLASANETFMIRLAFYESQGVFEECLQAMVAETVKSTMGLLPLGFIGPSWGEIGPKIRDSLEKELEATFHSRKTRREHTGNRSAPDLSAPCLGAPSSRNPVLDEINAAGGDSEEGLRRLIGTGGENLSPPAGRAILLARKNLAGTSTQQAATPAVPMIAAERSNALKQANGEAEPTPLSDNSSSAAAKDYNLHSMEFDKKTTRPPGPSLNYRYPSDFPAEEQVSIENAQRRADDRLQATAIFSGDEDRNARIDWFWLMVTAMAKSIGRVGATQTWTMSRRRELLKEFATATAEAAGIAGHDWQFSKEILKSERWLQLDDVILWQLEVEDDADGLRAIHDRFLTFGAVEAELTRSEPHLSHSDIAGRARTPRRVPDVKLSRERLNVCNRLARELATIKQALKGYVTPEALRKKYPDLALWEHLADTDLTELIGGTEFTPKAYAENLTLRAFGITSRETLKKDRQKVRAAERTKKA